MMRYTYILISMAVSLACTSTVWASPPPGWHENAKTNATEHVNIHVVRVEQVSAKGRIEVKVEAAVSKIHRSKGARLAIGDVIAIRYSRCSKYTPVTPDAGDPIYLSIEDHYEVYLNRADKSRGYKPAAAGQSFKKLEVQSVLSGKPRQAATP